MPLSRQHREPTEVRAAGWNLTGDAYRQDADGYFWYVSRTDDMIISSGYNISGVEVENILLTHPAWLNAPSSASPMRRGPIVKAFVVPAAGTEERTPSRSSCRNS
jgi:2-aminobenzoate-CoA ligase